MQVHRLSNAFLLIVIVALCLSYFARCTHVFQMILTEIRRDASFPEILYNKPNMSSLGGAPANPRGIAYVVYAHLLNNDTSSFTNFIFPSMDTWIKDGYFFVVLGEQWRESYRTHVCPESNDGTYTKYCDRIIPIFVDCPEGYYGTSPCCKNEKGMLYFVDHPELFRSYNWFMYMDADVYVRRDYIEKFVSDIDPSQDVILLAGKNGGRITKLGRPSFEFQRSPYNCSNEYKFMYPWGMPVIYSRQALLSMQNGFRFGGLTKQCNEFGVTHDVGNAIFHWMYQVPNVRIPWPASTKDMKTTSLGAHAIGKAGSNFSQVHEHFETQGVAIEDVVFAHEWHTVFGFNETQTYKKYGNPQTWSTDWHTMGVEGCRGNSTGTDGGPYVFLPQPWVKVKNGSWTV
jgi:hypothetical protein